MNKNRRGSRRVAAMVVLPIPQLMELYRNRAIWQDDPTMIHRTAEAVQACSVFSSRIPHKHQTPKMADVWPIENVWSIIKV